VGDPDAIWNGVPSSAQSWSSDSSNSSSRRSWNPEAQLTLCYGILAPGHNGRVRSAASVQVTGFALWATIALRAHIVGPQKPTADGSHKGWPFRLAASG
jgi:hypothetical protein